jgi:hypothetical protein
MKINNIALYANEIEVAEFSFADPKGIKPYQVTAVSGLDADSIFPRFYGWGDSDHVPFYSLQPGTREIALRISLNPEYTKGESHSELRDNLYRAISSNRSGRVQLRLRYGKSTVAATKGGISKFDTDHFVANPAVNLSITCDRPLLHSLEERIVEVWRFISGRPFTIQDVYSTAPHGFKMSLELSEDTTEGFEIKDPNGNWSFRVSGASLKAGDILHFSSESQDRKLYVDRKVNPDSDETEIVKLFEFIESSSVWPELFPGMNKFQINGIAGHKMLSLSYIDTFWGV